ncbi:restriction endonuclease subunit S [Aeromonas allosaccharophila]|uniref:restriction endonuclease subunit S n=2 Tax=Aeromonadaceae TaxID=84642 RepID=UPI003A49F74B
MARSLAKNRLPAGWKYDLLDKFSTRCSGHTPSKSFPEYWNGGIKWISLADSYRLDQGYVYQTDNEISEAGIANSSAELHPAETVVLSRDAGIGKSGVMAVPMAVSQHFIAWKCDNKEILNSWFLYNWLQLNKAEFERQAVGSTIKTIGLPYFKKLKIAVPPYPEQNKIAHVLSTWDKAISTTEQLLANSQQQKTALMQQLLTGKKRLLDSNGMRFSGEWSFITFDDMFKVNNKKSAQVKSSDYLEAGAVPVVDQGKQLIVGYCNNEEIYTDIPVIVFGDHTRCLKWVDFEFCPGADGTQVLDTKAGIDKKFGYYSLCFTDIPNLGYSRHMRELKEKDFKVPLDAKEQQKIAAVLSTADQEITTLQQKLDALKQEKKALMQQLLTGKRRVLVN